MRETLFASVALAIASLVIVDPVRADDPPKAALKVIENSLGMKFVRVPAGEFQMGSDESPEARAHAYPQYDRSRLEELTDETPMHTVRITRAFYLGQHEVTIGQFRKFLAASGYVAESEADGTGGYGYRPDYDPKKTERGDAFEGRNPKYSWRNAGFPQEENHPVLNVTMRDALAMAKWLGKREAAVYRLPTEAEWEYACRAGTRTRYFTGDDPQSLLGAANLLDLDTAANWPQWTPYALKGHDGRPFTSPVGSFSANAFGLYDMVGNAWEWVSDWYDEDYYKKSPVNDPRGGSVENVHVRRGGSWQTWALYARCSYRNFNTPESRYVLLGMRLLREE